MVAKKQVTRTRFHLNLFLRTASRAPRGKPQSLCLNFITERDGRLLYKDKEVAKFWDMDYTKYITIEPGKRSGKPCIRGMRITVYDVLGYLASGMSEDEILRDFPELTREDIRACLAFAADGERRLASIPA